MIFAKFLKAGVCFVPAVVSVFFLCALTANAQTLTGSIIGAVQDSSGGVVIGAQATLTSTQLPGGALNAVTDDRGAYRFTRLEAGIYALRVEYPGFSTYEETDLRVLTGGTTERIVTLQVSSTVTAITVSGESPAVDLYRPEIQQSITLEELEIVSTARYGVQSYMLLMPGVTTDSFDRPYYLQVMGSQDSENVIQSDGVTLTSVNDGGTWFMGNSDAAQEINMTTLGASAEYQGASGGVLQIITRSGTNSFHGDVAAYLSPASLASQPVKLPCDTCANGGETGFQWYNNRDVSGNISGPIVPNRLWFSSGVLYRARSITQPGQPKPDETFLEEIADMSTKITLKINDRLQFQQTLFSEHWSSMNPNPYTSRTRPIETLQRTKTYLNHINYGSSLDWTINSQTVLNARYNYLNAGRLDRIGFYEEIDTPIHRNSLTSVWAGNAPAVRFRPYKNEFNVKVNTYLPSSRASHDISYGAQISRNKSVTVTINPGGVIYWDYGDDPDYAVYYDGPDVQAANGASVGFWAEDKINLGRLSLEVGARYDWMTVTSPDAPQFDMRFNEIGTIKGLGKIVDWHSFSPRFGAAVRLTQDGKTVLRVNAGRYYAPLRIDDFDQRHPGRTGSYRMYYDTETGDYTTPGTVTTPGSYTPIDPDLRPPYTDQFSLGMEREVSRGLAVGFNLVYKRHGNILASKTLNAVYGTAEYALPDGRTYTVFPLLSDPNDREYLYTNRDDLYTNYRAFILTVTKRFADRWQLTAGYTRQNSKGQSSGSDPNDFINGDGGLGDRDRPHMFSTYGSYDIPKINVRIAGTLSAITGIAVASTTRVPNTVLPQGTRSINLEPAGSKYRTPNETFLHMRISKTLFNGETRKIELAGEIKNVLQEKDSRDYQSAVYNAANFLEIDSHPEPRQLRLYAKLTF